MNRLHLALRALLFGTVACCLGCSTQPPRIKPPAIDVESAATGAMEFLDADTSGSVSKDEAKAQCDGIAAAWQRYDQNDDGTITHDELVTRFSEWSEGDTGMMNMRAEVQFRGEPLADAVVTLTPYEFLGKVLLPAEGTTDQYGYTFLSIPKDLRGKREQGPHGMQVGLYRVSITHPKTKLSAKYNEASELSVDLGSGESNSGIRFLLK